MDKDYGYLVIHYDVKDEEHTNQILITSIGKPFLDLKKNKIGEIVAAKPVEGGIEFTVRLDKGVKNER